MNTSLRSLQLQFSEVCNRDEGECWLAFLRRWIGLEALYQSGPYDNAFAGVSVKTHRVRVYPNLRSFTIDRMHLLAHFQVVSINPALERLHLGVLPAGSGKIVTQMLDAGDALPKQLVELEVEVAFMSLAPLSRVL